MKYTNYFLIAIIVFLFVSCDKDDNDLTSITQYEQSLVYSMNDYRSDQGLGDLVIEYSACAEAKGHSTAMSVAKDQNLPSQYITDEIINKFGTQVSRVSTFTGKSNGTMPAAELIIALSDNRTIDSILRLPGINRCGVGVDETTDDVTTYYTFVVFEVVAKK